MRPDAGELLIDDCAVERLGRRAPAGLRRERIGYLPQEPSPIGFLSSEENVILALRVRGWDAEEAARASRAGARAARSRRPRAPARVAAVRRRGPARRARARPGQRPGLLIVDEPTSRLDEANADERRRAPGERRAGRDGQTVICASHDEQVIERADEVASSWQWPEPRSSASTPAWRSRTPSWRPGRRRRRRSAAAPRGSRPRSGRCAAPHGRASRARSRRAARPAPSG